MKMSLRKVASILVVAVAVVMSAFGISAMPAYAAAPCSSATDTSPSCTVCVSANIAAGMDEATAQTDCADATKTGVSNVWQMAKEVINWILIAAGIIAVGFIIWAGIRYVTSGGDAEKVKKAKNTLLYAIIGLLIAALALVIVNLILNVGGDVATS